MTKWMITQKSKWDSKNVKVMQFISLMITKGVKKKDSHVLFNLQKCPN